MSNTSSDIDCPCGSGKALSRCCAPLISGVEKASSAESLMRSRYSAYVLANERYLLDSWHVSTRPESLNLADDVKWLRLKIINSSKNKVEFVATYRSQGKAYKMHENSRFVYEDGNWFYVDGVSYQA